MKVRDSWGVIYEGDSLDGAIQAIGESIIQNKDSVPYQKVPRSEMKTAGLSPKRFNSSSRKLGN